MRRGGVPIPDPGWDSRGYDRISERFVAWAVGEDAIRAAVMFGSRVREDHPADEWADLDILVRSKRDVSPIGCDLAQTAN